jgi:hypothetical protein
LIKKVFLALVQKNETSLHRKSATEICRGLREIFFISKGLLSVKKYIHLPLLSLEEALRTRSVSCKQLYVVLELIEEDGRPTADIQALNLGLSFPPINNSFRGF